MKAVIKDKGPLALAEIAIVIASGFAADFVMKKLGVDLFFLPHLVFLFTAIVFRRRQKLGPLCSR